MPRSWQNVFQNGFTLRLSLSFRPSLSLPLSPFFLLYCFHPASFSLMAHTCQEKGCGTAMSTCARAMPVHPGSDHNVLLTVHNPDSVPTHLSKPHHHQQSGPCVTGGKKKKIAISVSAASRSRYCSNASTLETEPPKTAIIASLSIFLLPQWVCN